MPNDDLRSTLDTLATLREPTRLKLYRHVMSAGAAVSRDQAARAVGTTRALAAFHLDKLVAAGFLKAEYRRLSKRTGPGAGRPSKLYRRSGREIQVSLPQRQHELLASFLSGSISQHHGAASPGEVAREYGHALGARARHGLGVAPTPERLTECVETVLERLGFEPYRYGEKLLRLRNCPFDPLSRRFEGVVCSAGVALVEGVVDGVEAPGLGVAGDPDPERCCVVIALREPIQELRGIAGGETEL